MDDGAAVSRIERWTRQWLENEARKRGIRDPDIRSRAELLWAIGQHDFGARQSLRTARKLVGSILEGASHALPLLSLRRGHADHADHADTKRPTPAFEPSHDPAQLEAAQDTAPAQPSRLQLRREAGQLELTWQVNAQDRQRAQQLLGQPGELSLRIVSVQADPTQVVRSSITEHGPLDPNGAWTWTLPGPETHCVGAVGVRHGDRFVSIAHESSRVPLSSGG